MILLSLAAAALNPFGTGNDLLRTCTDFSNKTLELTCITYIAGVADGAVAGGEICPPSKTRYPLLKEIVIDRLQRNPGTRHERASDLIVRYLRQSFPCRDAN